ncbi:glycoside hydrolase family 3 N-terminal domain-containing protein [Chryseolinea sp. T2]|uniref:glycoside hydrolase family 3 protein n=1 Tax=Chryseolinea sp. T2 TaxID=3129255 RepID=UPI0030786A3A
MKSTSMRLLALAAIFSLGGMNSTVQAQKLDSLGIKIGQMLLIGFPGPSVDAAVLQEIRDGKIGSIILFEKNIPPQNSFIALKKIIWTYQHAAPQTLLVGIDQEGGRVNRLKDKYGFPRSITARAMGQAKTLDSVRFYGESTAATLAGLGFNINFAPVVDLASNPDNPIIAKHGRAFSANEDSVALLAREFIKAHRKYNVLTSLKHFPGHGSSKDDTHLGIADVTNTWEQRELKPYQLLIDSGYADAIMTSHIVNRQLDKAGNPGTLSTDILSGILRQRLHFDGVVFTDDMQMQAITKHYGLKDAIRMAIIGGVDIMTFSNNLPDRENRIVDIAHDLIRKMVASGEISEARIDQSYRRIMTMKKRLTAPGDLTAMKKELAMKEIELEKAQSEVVSLTAQLSQKATPPPATEEPSKKKKRKKK